MARRRPSEGRQGRMALGSRVRTDCQPSLAQACCRIYSDDFSPSRTFARHGLTFMSDRSSLVAKGLRILPATDGSTLRRYSFRMGLQFPRTRLVGKILRDVGAQSVGRSEVSEILRSVFGLPHKKDSIIEARIVATGYQSG